MHQFLLLLPIWSIGVVGLLFLGLLIFGRIPSAIGVGLFAIAAALSPFGKLGMASVSAVSQGIKLEKFAREAMAKCAKSWQTPRRSASTSATEVATVVAFWS